MMQSSNASTPEKLQNQPLLHAPHDGRYPRAVDDMLSKELNQLSFEDRNNLAEEIHGVRSLAPEETPELLEERLAQLKLELANTRQLNKHVYNQACRLYPHSYIHGDDFRLRFLRYELMDPQGAAKRLISFLNSSVELFGMQILARPLQMTDLGKDGMDLLRSGEYQCLPFRDRSGRRIMAYVGNFGLKFSIETRMKIIYYLHWVATEDVETQRKGLIGVFWWPTTSGITPTKPQQTAEKNANHPLSSDSEAEEQFLSSQDGLSHIPGPRDHIVGAKHYAGAPSRAAAVHVCLPDNPAFHFFRSSLALGLDSSRQRIKIHTGDGLALQYALHSYGIPVDLLPITETGNVKTKNHHRFIKMRTRREQERTSINSNVQMNFQQQSQLDSIIECPGMHDVVFRIGDSYLCHPGNAKFRGWIESTFDDFDAADKDRKVEITWTLVDEVLKTGRFLVWDKQWWSVVNGREKMRTKVVGAFKDQKRRLKASSNVQVNQSSTHKFEGQDGRKRKRDDVSCFSACYK